MLGSKTGVSPSGAAVAGPAGAVTARRGGRGGSGAAGPGGGGGGAARGVQIARRGGGVGASDAPERMILRLSLRNHLVRALV